MHGRMLMGYGAAGGGASFPVDAAEFTSGDYLTIASDFTGLADSKLGLLSYWVKRAATGQDYSDLLNTYSGAVAGFNPPYFEIFLDGTPSGSGEHRFGIWAQTSFGPDVSPIYMYSNTQYNDTNWHHVLMSWDTADAAKCFVYVDGVSDKGSSPDWFGVTNNTIDYTNGAWTFGRADADRTSYQFAGCVAEFYFAPGQWLDLSVLANREKFRSAGGKPVDLGATGSTPTGTAPKVYLHLNDAEAASGWATNDSGNGNFTITGTLTTCASSPSD
jgi:hypothetical protein